VVLATPDGEITLRRDLDVVFEPYSEPGCLQPSIRLTSGCTDMQCLYSEGDWARPAIDDVQAVQSLISFRKAIDFAANSVQISTAFGTQLLNGLRDCLDDCVRRYFPPPSQ